MLRISAALVGLLVVAAAAGVPAVAAQERVTLTVSVVTAGDDPVADATLEATWSGGSTTESTASNGKAFVDVLAGANVTIEVDHPDYVRNEPYEITDADAANVEVTVRPKGSLTMAVTDANGAVAEAGVIVRQHGSIVVNGRTDGSGTYDTGTIEVGTYDVEVVKRGYYGHEVTVEVDGDVDEAVTVERGSVVLEFNVTDPHFSPAAGVAAATISIDGVGTFNTLDDGEASARVPVNAVLSLSATKAGYEETTRTVQIGESARTIDVNLSKAPLVNLSTTSDRVLAGERVAGEVTDEYGEPVAGATVLLDGGAVGETDADGEFAVRVEAAGNHTLRASLGDLTSTPVVVEAVAAGGEEPAATTAAPTTDAPTETNTTPATTETGGMAGFTVAIALVALLLAGLVAAGRGRRQR